MNHAEFINKLEELSHLIQGVPVSKWELFWSQATVMATIIIVALILGVLTVLPLMSMHLAVKDEIKDSVDSSSVLLWFLSMSVVLVFSVLTGVMSWCFVQEFVSKTVDHEKELQQQYDLHQQTSTELYNHLVDMSDDDFEKLTTAKSSYKLTKEQDVKYKDVIRAIDEVAGNKKRSHE